MRKQTRKPPNLLAYHQQKITELVKNPTEYYNYFNKNAFELVNYYHLKRETKSNIINRYSKNNNTGEFLGKVKENKETCNNCDKEVLIQKDSSNICQNCSYISDALIIAPTQISYTENLNEVEKVQFTYDRKYHFRDLLLQFQGKESLVLPEGVLCNIYKEIKKYNIPIENIYKEDIRKILKKIKMSNLYDHSAYILKLINPKNCITFPSEIENKLIYMFNAIQEPFSVYCPENRKNILNYNYIFYKFCQILDLESMNIDYKNNITLLKCKEKLMQYEKTWKQIIKYMNDNPKWNNLGIQWVFIPIC